MKQLVKKHPLAIRWFHWINFPVLTIMIWSGLLIYWANDVYQLGVGKLAFHFFPTWFYDKLQLNNKLALGLSWHFAFMWIFAINGIAYVLYTAFSGEWRYLIPNKNTLSEAYQVVLYDLFISRKHPPKRKFNGAQQIAYTSVILMGLGSLLTGLAIYRSVQFAWLTTLLGGYPMARFSHFWLTVGYCLFFLVHIGQVIKTGWNNFRAMLTGYEVEKVETPLLAESNVKSTAQKPAS